MGEKKLRKGKFQSSLGGGAGAAGGCGVGAALRDGGVNVIRGEAGGAGGSGATVLRLTVTSPSVVAMVTVGPPPPIRPRNV